MVSEYFGEKKYAEMKKTLKFGLLLILLKMVCYLAPLFFLAVWFIKITGISERDEDKNIAKYYSISEEVSIVLWSLYPCALLQATTELLKTYAYSQGIEIGFGEFALASVFATSPICWLCIVKYKMGIMGYVVYKYLSETLNLGYALFVFFKKLHPSTTNFTFKDIQEAAQLPKV